MWVFIPTLVYWRMHLKATECGSSSHPKIDAKYYHYLFIITIINSFKYIIVIKIVIIIVIFFKIIIITI